MSTNYYNPYLEVAEKNYAIVRRRREELLAEFMDSPQANEPFEGFAPNTPEWAKAVYFSAVNIANVEFDIVAASPLYSENGLRLLFNAGSAPVHADIEWERDPVRCQAIVDRVRERGY